MWLGQTLGLSVIFVLNTPPPLVKSNFQKAIFQNHLFEKRLKYPPPPPLKTKILKGGGVLNEYNGIVKYKLRIQPAMLHYMYNCFKHHRIFNIHMKFFGVSIFLFMGVHDKSNSYSWLFPLKQIHTHQRSWMTQIHTHRKFMGNSLFFIRILTNE